MLRNTFVSRLAATPTLKLVLGVGLCSLGGAMLYAYFRNREDEEVAQELQNTITPQNVIQRSPLRKEISIKIAIANEHIPILAGRGGSNLALIEERTQTTIRFRDKDDLHKFCEITGFPDGVKEARAFLLRELERAPTVKEQILVPSSVCGKIVGRAGEAMQEICRLSMAKVSLDSGGRSGGMDRRRITITGNRQQVNIARKLIEEKIQEDEEVRRLVDEIEQQREPRRSPTHSISSSMYSSQTSLTSYMPPSEKLLAAVNVEDKTLEVYISASASPSKFWVQLIGPQSKKLDDLVEAMSEYYISADHRKLHRIAEPYLGQIVATIFKNDGKWYRAEIVGILPNQYNPDEVVLDLYFVDYGDSEYVRTHEVFELRTDFLTLRFQAVECFLANVKSNILNDPETWDPQSIQKFEELTQVGNWKKLISRVVTYKERPKSTNGATSASREGSPIPGVELYDSTEGVEVNIGHLLISNGYALPADDQRPLSPYMAPPKHSAPVAKPENLPGPSPIAKKAPEATSKQDTLMQQQVQHLQRNINLSSNRNNEKQFASPAKLTTQFINGNFMKQDETSSINETRPLQNYHNTNSNLRR